MARVIGMKENANVYRAVTRKTFADGTTATVYEGPYDQIGTARARITFWRNHFTRYGKGGSADGHVEECQPEWKPVPEPRRRSKAR
ncbi:hypothetical protein ABT224_20025 [Streptomyces sp. NPDC001584]|uniref:hypothetical protein n=1 Tax=Streptomyces sp. NPDC001584 TaxID=3154521 RepID=UPI003320478D